MIIGNLFLAFALPIMTGAVLVGIVMAADEEVTEVLGHGFLIFGSLFLLTLFVGAIGGGLWFLISWVPWVAMFVVAPVAICCGLAASGVWLWENLPAIQDARRRRERVRMERRAERQAVLDERKRDRIRVRMAEQEASLKARRAERRQDDLDDIFKD